MRLLDLFCCAGGAARGYAAAGFQVVGVDIEPQPNYPFEFHQVNAFQFLVKFGAEFDAIHASPPCQGYSSHVSSRSSDFVPTLGKDEPRLIAPLRELLVAVGKPYVIENVYGARAELRNPTLLCGSMFGLPISRHRLFETSFPLAAPMHDSCRGIAKRYAEAQGWEYRDMSVTGKGRRKGTSDRWKQILGLTGTTMTQHELAECIPPAYTKFIGNEFMKTSNLAISGCAS